MKISYVKRLWSFTADGVVVNFSVLPDGVTIRNPSGLGFDLVVSADAIKVLAGLVQVMEEAGNKFQEDAR